MKSLFIKASTSCVLVSSIASRRHLIRSSILLSFHYIEGQRSAFAHPNYIEERTHISIIKTDQYNPGKNQNLVVAA